MNLTLEMLAHRAKDGYMNSGEEYFFRLANILDGGGEIPNNAREHLVQLIRCSSSDRALLKRVFGVDRSKRGVSRSRPADRQQQLCKHVYREIEHARVQEKRRMSAAAAQRNTAQVYGVSVSTVEKAWENRAARRKAKASLNDYCRYLNEENAPPI